MADTLQDEATSIHASARSHKHASAYHRREARKQMILLAALQEKAGSLGIKLIITPNGEGKNHGQAKSG